MRFLDTSYLLDYLDPDREHHDAAGEYINDYGHLTHGASAFVFFEAYRGAIWPQGEREMQRTREAIEWVEPVPLTDAAVQEAARIEFELLNDGDPIGTADTIIAGAVREANGTVVTRDTGFERVSGLSVHNYADD